MKAARLARLNSAKEGRIGGEAMPACLRQHEDQLSTVKARRTAIADLGTTQSMAARSRSRSRQTER